MNVKVINIILGILCCFSIIGCMDYPKVSDQDCKNVNDKRLSSIAELLKKSGSDSSFRLFFDIDYSRKGFYLIDKENKWELNFSDKYFNVYVKYFDGDFVILYCAISGIMNGLTVFPIDHDDLFVINRKSGKKVLDIQSKEGGITKVAIKDNIIYFEYYDPDVIKYFKMQ
jgi:hypothetical protein